jgi:hypothetical protein
MLSSILVALSPFILNAVMGVAKWAGGLQGTAGKRFLLAVLSLVGVVSFSALNGTPVDPNSISSLVQTILEAFVAFLAAHGSYHLFFSQPSTPAAPANLPTT